MVPILFFVITNNTLIYSNQLKMPHLSMYSGLISSSIFALFIYVVSGPLNLGYRGIFFAYGFLYLMRFAATFFLVHRNKVVMQHNEPFLQKSTFQNLKPQFVLCVYSFFMEI